MNQRCPDCNGHGYWLSKRSGVMPCRRCEGVGMLCDTHDEHRNAPEIEPVKPERKARVSLK